MRRWDVAYSPSNFDEMALYPELRELLIYYYDSRDIPHVILHGDTGTGKSTTAFILAQRVKPTFTQANVFDCAGEKKASHVKQYAEQLAHSKGGLSAFFSSPEPECFIFDEFHNIDIKHQTMLNIVLETSAADTPCFFCINDIDTIAEPIKSRCRILRFDVAAIINDKLVMREGMGWSATEWKNELRRVGRIATKKVGVDIDEKIEDKVLSTDRFCVDVRKFFFNLGEAYERKIFYAKKEK
jgi:DNA polymerase III delta prime subunit